MGTEFTIYNNGENPSNKKLSDDKVRNEHGVVLYESNVLGSKGPRKMKILVPSLGSDGRQLVWKPRDVSCACELPSLTCGAEEGHDSGEGRKGNDDACGAVRVHQQAAEVERSGSGVRA